MQKSISICILRLSSLGDIVLTSVLLRCIKYKFPEANIVFVVAEKYADIIKYNPHCSHIVTVDTKNGINELFKKRKELLHYNNGEKFDIVLDLHRNIRTGIIRLGIGKQYGLINKFRKQKLELVHKKKGKGEPIVHIVDRYMQTAEKWGIVNDGKGLELWLESEKKKKEYAPDTVIQSKQKIIGVAPGARHFTKRYPVEKFIDLLKGIKKKFPEIQFSLFGGEEEKELCSIIEKQVADDVRNYAGLLSVLDSAAEIDRCSLMISNDSGLMHIAAARRVPIIAIFGSTVKEFGFTPYMVNNVIMETDMSCRPCSHIGRDSCPLGHFECMEKITPLMIADSVEKFFIR